MRSSGASPQLLRVYFFVGALPSCRCLRRLHTTYLAGRVKEAVPGLRRPRRPFPAPALRRPLSTTRRCDASSRWSGALICRLSSRTTAVIHVSGSFRRGLDSANVGRYIEDFDRRNRPIDILTADGRVFGRIHYGVPAIVNRLRWVPVVQIAAILLFVAVGYMATPASSKASSAPSGSVWPRSRAPARTPISSLLWLGGAPARTGGGGRTCRRDGGNPGGLHPRDPRRDGERRGTAAEVAMRFGQVGSLPRAEMQDVAPIVSEAVRYFRRRIPHLGKDVEIRERYELVPRSA